MSRPVSIQWLGRIGYAEALQLQENEVARKIAGDAGDKLFLLEHEPIYTVGRSPDENPAAGDALAIPVVHTNRGGKTTYHGPGQLIGYPIIDLRRRSQDLHRYLRSLEELLIDLVAGEGISAGRREGLTGVWVENRKIASIGVGIRRWVTMHGFALNVGGDLTPFQQIVPCGIAGVEMTSIERETQRAVTVDEIAHKIAATFADKLEAMLPAAAAEMS